MERRYAHNEERQNVFNPINDNSSLAPSTIAVSFQNMKQEALEEEEPFPFESWLDHEGEFSFNYYE